MKIIAGMGSWIELKYPAYQGRDEIRSTQIPRVERARGDGGKGKHVRLRNGTVINPGGPILFLRSACTQRIAAPASINEWPGRLIGIKAYAGTDRDNAPCGFAASTGAIR